MGLNSVLATYQEDLLAGATHQEVTLRQQDISLDVGILQEVSLPAQAPYLT